MKRRLWEVSVIVLVVIAIWRGVVPMLNTTDLDSLDLRGLGLRESTFAGKTLIQVDLRDAELRGVNFRGAELWEVDLRGVKLDGPDFHGAVYDRFTRWPAGFDPRRHGAERDFAVRAFPSPSCGLRRAGSGEELARATGTLTVQTRCSLGA